MSDWQRRNPRDPQDSRDPRDPRDARGQRDYQDPEEDYRPRRREIEDEEHDGGQEYDRDPRDYDPREYDRRDYRRDRDDRDPYVPPRRQDARPAQRDEEPPPSVVSFLPSDGIDLEVLAIDLKIYLGPSSLNKIKPGVHPEDGKTPGYWVTGERTLTVMTIADLKADTIRWREEQRRDRRAKDYANSKTHQNRVKSGPSENKPAPRSEDTLTRKEAELLIAQKLREAGKVGVGRAEFEQLVAQAVKKLPSGPAPAAAPTTREPAGKTSQGAPPPYDKTRVEPDPDQPSRPGTIGFSNTGAAR